MSVSSSANDWPTSAPGANGSKAEVSVHEARPDTTPSRVLPAEPLWRKILRGMRTWTTFGGMIALFMVLNCFQLLTFVVCRPISLRAYRAVESWFCKYVAAMALT